MTYTHEQFIQAVRDIVAAKLEDPKPLLDAKLAYGAGSPSLRGVTYYERWQNGQEKTAFAEICAFGESNNIQLAGTTIHELAHVISRGSGHAKGWVDACNRLGLRFVRAAGTRYSMACFAPDVREAISKLPAPTDGKPSMFRSSGLAGGAPLQAVIRPCLAGIGTRGGKSRGPGSGSRLRKFVCGCGVIVRASRDVLDATCNLCESKFERA